MTPGDDPTTQELRAIQSARQEAEREAAQDAPTDDALRAHERRADKAGYLEEKLAEQERTLGEDEA